jgi:iron complex transport system substrate-binding protein
MRWSLLVLSCLALAASGCGERTEPLGDDVPEFPVEVDGAGPEPTRLEAEPERIAALTMGTAELVGALGAANRLVAVPAGATIEGTVEAERVTRPSGLVDVAVLAGLDPELILAATSTNRGDLERAARRSGAAVYLEPDRSYSDVVRAVRDVGFLAGEAVEARRLVARLREQLGAVSEAVSAREPVRVFVDTGLLVTVPDDSLPADLVRRAGGVPVGTDRAGVAREPCEVVALRPAVVLRLVERTSLSPPRSRFDRCPGGARITVAQLPAELVARPGPRVGDALERVARALHPDAF